MSYGRVPTIIRELVEDWLGGVFAIRNSVPDIKNSVRGALAVTLQSFVLCCERFAIHSSTTTYCRGLEIGQSGLKEAVPHQSAGMHPISQRDSKELERVSHR